MSTEEDNKTCGRTAQILDGPTLTCVRDDRHINHRATDGTEFMRAGNGFIIKDADA